MNMIRWIAFGILGGIFVLLSTVNAYYLWLQFRKPNGSAPSLAPLLGGLAGVLALLVMPTSSVVNRLWWTWLPIVIDAGTGYYFIGGGIGLLTLKMKDGKTQPPPAK